MTTDQAQSILSWAVNNGATDVAVLGGEPTMHPNISALIEIAKNSGLKTVRVVSNGGAACRSFLQTPAAAVLDALYLSIDGPDAEIHDAIRGPGSFEHLLSSFSLARRVGVPVVATLTINSDNAGRAAEIVSLSRSLGAVRANVHWMSASGRATLSGKSLDAEAWRRVVDSVSAIPVDPNFSIDIQAAYKGDDASASDSTFCAVRDHSNLQFMPSGAVHACGLTVDQAGRSGYVWTGSEVVVRDGVTELDECQSADAEGGCPLRRPAAGSTLHETPICIYIRRGQAITRKPA